MTKLTDIHLVYTKKIYPLEKNDDKTTITPLSTDYKNSKITKRKLKQEFVRPRWPYDMRPSARAEKYIRDAGP